jgi:hypothetical protein
VRSLSLLSGIATDDAELDRLARLAVLKLSRTRDREDRGGIVLDRTLPRPMECFVRCRAGLSQVLKDELANLGPTAIRSPSVVCIRYGGNVRRLLGARTAIDFAIRVDLGKGGAPIESRVVDALFSEDAQGVLGAWTDRTPRFRLAFARAGHRRARSEEHTSELQSPLI